MSRGTPDPARRIPISRTGLSPCIVGLPRSIPLYVCVLYAVHDPAVLAPRFGLFPFRSPLLWESMFSFFSSGYLDVSVHRVPPACLWIQHAVHEGFSCEFPHSEIRGSMDICSSPRLFAAYHVFRRLLVPRHPPCALPSLTSAPCA